MRLAALEAKSKQLANHTSHAERDSRVEDLIVRLESEPVEWSTAVSYSSTSIQHKAAAVCVLSQKTITRVEGFSGDAVIVPDGSSDMYGRKQSILRQQASQMFGGSFQSAFGEVYISALPKADLTYPEVAAADYISAYFRSKAQMGVPFTELPENVVLFDPNWREPEASPAPFYSLYSASGDHGIPERNRVIAWLRGRHPEGDDFDISSQYENTVSQMVNSETVQEYLLDM